MRCDLTRPTQHLGPHAPTFLALVVEERRSVVPHVEAHSASAVPCRAHPTLKRAIEERKKMGRAGWFS